MTSGLSSRLARQNYRECLFAYLEASLMLVTDQLLSLCLACLGARTTRLQDVCSHLFRPFSVALLHSVSSAPPGLSIVCAQSSLLPQSCAWPPPAIAACVAQFATSDPSPAATSSTLGSTTALHRRPWICSSACWCLSKDCGSLSQHCSDCHLYAATPCLCCSAPRPESCCRASCL